VPFDVDFAVAAFAESQGGAVGLAFPAKDLELLVWIVAGL
jgi:hypothetical protein